MNQDTIERLIKSLGKANFDAVVALVMEKVFNQKAVDVDGKGDGGLDLRFYENNYNKTTGVQKTIQNEDWEKKFYNDAQKANKNFGITQFYFFTTQTHEQKRIHEYQEKISNELGVFANLYGAKDIAGFLVNEKLLVDFAKAINLDISVHQNHEIDNREVLLHTYYTLSNDRKNLQNEIYDNSILAILADKGAMGRDTLITKTAALLTLTAEQDFVLNSRIDSLLSTQKIIKNHKYNTLTLSKEFSDNINISVKIYESEMALLKTTIEEIVVQNRGSAKEINFSEMAILLAKSFVEQQLENASSISLSLNLSGFTSNLNSPLDRLKGLLARSGILSDKMNCVLESIHDVAKKNILIQKLMTAVVFVCLRNIPNHKSVTMFKTNNWSNVLVYLDSSVAIPYISSKIFGPSIERFSRGSNYTINMLSKLGANIILPYDYLNECASHLIAAKDYCTEDNLFDDEFAYSGNGYVSHYFQLKKMGERIPGSLKDYIDILSPNVFRDSISNVSNECYVLRVMQDLQRYFKDYRIICEKYETKNINPYRKKFEESYSYIVNKSRRKSKTSIQIDHDIKVLSHMNYVVDSTCNSLIFLTWDKGLTQLCRDENDSIWVVNPVAAVDLIQTYTQASDMTLMSLGHSIAKVMNQKAEIAGRIIDKIVELSKEKFLDYEYRQKVRQIKDEAFKTFDLVDPGFNVEDFEDETYRQFIMAGLLPNENITTNSEDMAAQNER